MFQINTGKVVADVSGQITVTNKNPTLLYGNMSVAGATIGTVPALKKWTIIRARIMVYGATGNGYLALTGTKAASNWLMCNMGAITNNNAEAIYQSDYTNGIVLSAGDTITEDLATGQGGRYEIEYVEETA